MRRICCAACGCLESIVRSASASASLGCSDGCPMGVLLNPGKWGRGRGGADLADPATQANPTPCVTYTPLFPIT